ncbi:MAG: lytic transglycosylase F [Proteobacteria bacterium]|nr:lytic transglycosylase F [Pseudomonadota bacterium]
MTHLVSGQGLKHSVTSRLLILCFLFFGSLWPLHASALENQLEAWTGDFEDMLERREIRVLVVYNKLLYFLDGPKQQGTTVDGFRNFEDFVNKKYKLKTRKMNIVFLPVTREELIPALLEGRGDIASANLTITPERLEQVDFTDPFLKDIKEVLVSGPSAPEINSLAELAGKEIHVRQSSSYYTSLTKLNIQLEENGLAPVELTLTEEFLEDSDLLEMVNAGLLPMIIVDNHKAQFWSTVFDQIKVHEDIAITVGGSIAWAIRKDSPTLTRVLNEFVKDNKKGTLHGNMILNRYLRDNKWVKNSLGDSELKQFHSTTELFQNYAGQYDFDWLMIVALAFQESGLDQSARSHTGAIGIMQLLPSTAADKNVNIPKIEILENNIHAGTKYLRFLRNRYFSNPNIDKLNQTLLSFAAYNAGPGKISKLRKETAERGLDPNVWFGNLEHIVAKKVGRETVQYVANIYKYYIAYTLLTKRIEERGAAKTKLSESLE